MPTPHTLKRSPLAQLEQSKPIIRQRHLQLQLSPDPLRARHDAYDLPVDLKAVEEMGEVGEIERRSILAVNVQPDQTIRANCATKDLSEVDQVDIRKTGVNERDYGIKICGAKGGSMVIGRGDVDWWRVDGFGDPGEGRVGRHKLLGGRDASNTWRPNIYIKEIT